MKIKQTIKKIEEEIKFFGGKGFDKRKALDIDLTDNKTLSALFLQAKLSGYKQALKDVLSEIKKMRWKSTKEKEYGRTVTDILTEQEGYNKCKEELKKPIQEVLK